jgi:hypothetical protein
MNNLHVLADRAIERAKNLREFTVFRPIEDIVFDGDPIPYTMSHTLGMPVELTVPAISQEEAEQRVDAWLRRQRDAA